MLRAYRSRVDGSVQPYAVSIPGSYDPAKPMRLDVVLHGRNSRLSEVSFIAAHAPDRPVPLDQDRLILEVFGRTNNAYRWAGETDVFEALEAARANYNVDPQRIVLRGFSMGGAGAWHIGLHYPDRWAAVEAGAGFTDTLDYAQASLGGGVAAYHARRCAFTTPSITLSTRVIWRSWATGEKTTRNSGQRSTSSTRLPSTGAQFSRQGLDWSTQSLNAIFLSAPQRDTASTPKASCARSGSSAMRSPTGGKRRKASAA